MSTPLPGGAVYESRRHGRVQFTRLLQRWKWPRAAKSAFEESEYANLLRYTLQIAAEREVAAGVLAELSELLERNAPAWYADEQRQRVESALELLQRL